jgi:hypothetical protein
MNRILLPCLLALTACSAEVFVETEPFNQTVPILSLVTRVYAEVAIDVPPEAQGLDVVVHEISADLTVVNPSQTLTLEAGARLSLEGQATPGMTVPVTYTDQNRPEYFPRAEQLLPTQSFAPQARKAFVIDNPVLVKAAGRPRIWLIVDNTLTHAGIGTPRGPYEIRLENIVFRARVTKPFPGIGGGLEVGGL